MTLDEIKDKIAMEKYNTHWLGMDSHARASLVDEVARQYADHSKVKNLSQPDVSGQLPLEFVAWYSGMTEDKIKNAFERWKREVKR